MSLNVRSGEGQLPTFVNVLARSTLLLGVISTNVVTAVNTPVSVGNVPGVALAKLNAIAQNNFVVEVLNVPGRALATLIADPDFKTQVTATRPGKSIGGTGFVHAVSAVNTPNQAPAWTTVPTITFTQGTAASVSVASYATDPESQPLAITHTSGSFPAGVTFNTTTKSYVYDGSGPIGGTNGHILTADDITGDWATRSTAAGVVKAASLSAASEISAYYFTGAEAVPPTLSTVIKAAGQSGSIKFTSSPSDASESGALLVPFGRTFVPGETLWLAFRQYMTPEWAYMTHPVSSTGQEQGMKQIILSSNVNFASHTYFEIVLENSLARNVVWGYNERDLSDNVVTWGANVPGGDIIHQPLIDNTGAGVVSPDSVYSNVNGGTDPDTGSAFSADQITWARYGGSYDSRTDPAFAFGLGHPLWGSVRYPTNQWVTWLLKVQIGAWDTSTSRITLWMAPESQGYTKVFDQQNARLGGDSAAPGFNAIWLTAYYTNRLSNQGKSVASRTNSALQACAAVRVVGNGSALGAGTLTYTASNKRFTWREAGGTTGTARGAASWKRFINAITGGGSSSYDTGKYLGLEVTNFAALPVTDQTDTITIQSGRGSQNSYYNELIVSTQAINAPGGFAPT